MAEKNIIVKKEKALVNAIYKLTLDEQRVFHYAIAKVNPFKHRYGQYYLVELKKVIDFYGLDSKSAYKEFYNAIDTLFNRQFTYFNEQLQKQVTGRIIADKINDNAGVVGFRFSDQIAEMITADKDFLKYKLAQTINITSPNANRLYEILLYSLQRSPVNKLNKNIGIDELKELMGLDDKYKVFAEFKRKVLEVCKAQINKHTDIRITYEVVKIGRTPTELKFIAQYKKNHEPDSPAVDLKQQEEIPLEQAPKERTEAQTTVGKRALAAVRKTLKKTTKK